MTEKITINGSKGKLSALIQKPDIKEGTSVPMAMLLHGFASNKNDPLMSAISEKLYNKGYATILFDFNGHGESDGDFSDMTVPNEIEDAKKVLEYILSLDYVSEVYVAGHSQGGVVASMLAGTEGEKRIKKVVLLAPAAVLRDDTIRGNTMGAQYDPFNPPDKVHIHGDIYLGKEYIKTAFRLPIYETAEKYTGKVCVIHGTGDRLVPYTYGERYKAIYKNCELHLLEGFDHGFSQNLNNTAEIAVDFFTATLI